MHRNRIYDIHGFLRVISSIGHVPPAFEVQDEPDSGIDLTLAIEENKFFEAFDLNQPQIMPGLYFDSSRNAVVSRLSPFRVPLWLSIENFNCLDAPTSVSMNNAYVQTVNKFVKQPISSLFPIEHFVKLTIGGELALRNVGMSICGALRINGVNVIVCGFGGSGKTSFIQAATKKLSFNSPCVLSEDTCLLKGGQVYSYPQLVRQRTGGSPFWSSEKFCPPDTVFSNTSNAPLTPQVVIFLERSNEFQMSEITPSQVMDKVLSINRKILPFSFERCQAASLYALGGSANIADVETRSVRECFNLPGFVLQGSIDETLSALEQIVSKFR